jgi:hypothetical protein
MQMSAQDDKNDADIQAKLLELEYDFDFVIPAINLGNARHFIYGPIRRPFSRQQA